MHLIVLLICFCQTFSLPVTTENPTCPPCEWTEWYNVDHPKVESNSGDWETLENITALGFDVCKVPRDIKCRSARFPYIPFNELLYNTQCDKSTGLTCLNQHNEAPCIDFEVQFLCCSCDQKPKLQDHTSKEIPTSPENPTCPPCKWTEWFNVDHPKQGSNSGDWETLENITARGFHVCKVPRDIKCRSARFPYVPFKELQYNTQCDRSAGLICLNRNNEAPCIDFEVQFFCCPCDDPSATQMPVLPTVTTEIPTCPPCKWTEWYNVNHPKVDSNSGDWETLENITARGFDVCKVPKDIKCRSARFPYIPFNELQYNTQCARSAGLICLNKNNEAPCIDFEVQFFCCPCNEVPPEPSATQMPALPTVTTENHTCPPCEWTDWYNVDHPKVESNSGDWETLENITARGFHACKIPRDIKCRSARFPYIPFNELLYNTQCDKSTGLTCLNQHNEAPCIDFEVQFLCCSCDQKPKLPDYTSKEIPTSPENPTCPPCKWTEWFNVDHPKQDSNSGDWETLENITARGFDVCRVPRNIKCRSARFPYVPFKELQYNTQCDRSAGLICLNKNNEAPCIDFEVQFFCCPCDDSSATRMPALPTGIPATGHNAQCIWTDWFNTHQATPGPDGGDFENVTAIMNLGYSICTAPQAAECRLVRFPYIPLGELYYIQECSASRGLVCSNKNQESGECLDYEARFLCCAHDDNQYTVASNNRLDDTNQGVGVSSETTHLTSR